MDNDQFYEIFKSYLRTEISSSLETTEEIDSLKRLKEMPGVDTLIKTCVNHSVEYVKDNIDSVLEPLYSSLTEAEKEYWQVTVKGSLSPTGIEAMAKVRPVIKEITKNAQEAFMHQLMLGLEDLGGGLGGPGGGL